jgi:hypothetical protein
MDVYRFGAILQVHQSNFFDAVDCGGVADDFSPCMVTPRRHHPYRWIVTLTISVY